MRHAPVTLANDIYGHIDLTCDCSDTAAFTALAAHLPVPAVVVRSSLSRTRHTLEALLAAGWTAAAESLVESAFTEQAFGAWEGVSWENLKDKPYYTSFWSSPFIIRPPLDGENFLDVIIRVKNAINSFLKEYSGCDIVVVAHAGSIRAALAIALHLTPEQVHAVAVEPLSVTRLDHRCTTSWQVQGVNIRFSSSD